MRSSIRPATPGARGRRFRPRAVDSPAARSAAVSRFSAAKATAAHPKERFLTIRNTIRPLIHAATIGSSANFGGTLAPGMIVTVFGTHLAWSEQTASRFPLLTQMNAVALTVNGTRMPLLYVGPTQVNFQLPYSLVPGPLRI